MELATNQSNFEQLLISAISDGIPLVKHPYATIADEIGCTENEVIEGIRKLIQSGDIKRFGIVVRHRNLGYQANAMAVWNIPDERIEELGIRISRYNFVNLCYQRPRRLPDWPYNLFCMIHGTDRADVMSLIDMVNQHCGLDQYAHEVLFSRTCFKQRGARYQSGTSATDNQLSLV